MAVLVRDDDAELERVVDRLEPIVTAAPVSSCRQERAEIDVAERVTGDDEERLVERAAREADQPAVPSGSSSIEYSTLSPSDSPSPK